MNNIYAVQNQLTKIDDGTLRQALSSPNPAVPQFLLMMEMNRRSGLRGNPTGPAPQRNMRSEMAMGIYQPVPTPPVRLPPVNAGVPSYGGQGAGPQTPPTPSQADPSTSAGLGSLFSQRRF